MLISSSSRPARQTASSRRRRTGGFMLIEVLVSVLIFSVGVLAVVGLQATMSRAQAASKDRADAASLANEVIGLMWSDTAAINSLAAINSYSGSSCTAYARCADWANKVAANLPKGASNITVTLVTGETSVFDVNITITWALPDGGMHTYTTQTTVSMNS